MMSDNLAEFIAATWSGIAADLDAEAYPGIKRRRVPLGDSPRNLYVAIDGTYLHRMLILDASAAVIRDQSFRKRDFKGIRLSRGRSVGGGDKMESVIITLKDDQYAQLFDYLIADICQYVTFAESDGAAMAVMLERLESWHGMTAAGGREILSIAAQTGLFGELYFMQSELLGRKTVNPVNAWQGPLGARHDFQWRAGAVEIKTSTANNPQHIIISNESQLDSSEIDHLLLWYLSVSEHKAGQSSLPEIIRSIRGALRESQQMVFGERLQSAGYFEEDEPEYEDRRYIVQGVTLYDVRPGFPALTPADLPPGISNVSYTIERSACGNFITDPQTLDSLMEHA